MWQVPGRFNDGDEEAAGTAVGVNVVPCNGCTRCCHGDAVRLLPGDDTSQYQSEPHPTMPGERMLAHRANGDCVYLGTGSCTIHDRRPQMCREMDCRLIAQRVSWTQARNLDTNGSLPMAVWRRGRDPLKVGDYSRAHSKNS